jgi:hypothetical protein
MVGNMVGVEFPEILFVSEQIHNLSAVGIFSKGLKCRYNAFERGTVAYNVDPGKNNTAVKVL